MMSPLAKYVLRNLGTRPFITALVIGSMLVVSMTIAGVSAAAVGLRRAFSEKGHENWVIVVVPSASTEDNALSPNIVPAVSAASQVVRVSPEVVITSSVAQFNTVLNLRGLDPQGFDMRHPQMLSGRLPENGAPEFIVGEALAQRMPEIHEGTVVDLVDTKFKCVGVFKSTGFTSGEVWAPRSTIMQDPTHVPLSVVYLETPSAADAIALSERIKRDQRQAVDAMPEPQFFERVIGGYKHVVLGLSLIFFLVVSGAVLTAASVIALLQQRRLSELCVMRAMGFRDSAIAKLIVAETLLVVLIGGSIGVTIVGIALHNFVLYALTAKISAVNFHASLTPDLAFSTLGVMFLIGLGGAIAPILRMKRMPITRGLREE